MTISIIIKGKNFTKSVGRLGLVHGPETYRILGFSEASSLASRLYTTDIASVVGAGVSYSASEALISSPQTGGIVTESGYYGGGGNFTMFAVPKRITATQVLVVGAPHNTSNSSLSGWGILYQGGNFGIKTNGGSRLITVSQNQGDGFAFVAARGSSVSRQLTIDYYGLDGRVVETEIYAGYSIGPQLTFRAGNVGMGTGAYSLAAMGNFHRYLTDAELDDVYLQVKDDLGRRGVVIP